MCYYSIHRVGRSNQILYFSTSTNTTVLKYSIGTFSSPLWVLHFRFDSVRILRFFGKEMCFLFLIIPFWSDLKEKAHVTLILLCTALATVCLQPKKTQLYWQNIQRERSKLIEWTHREQTCSLCVLYNSMYNITKPPMGFSSICVLGKQLSCQHILTVQIESDFQNQNDN